MLNFWGITFLACRAPSEMWRKASPRHHLPHWVHETPVQCRTPFPNVRLFLMRTVILISLYEKFSIIVFSHRRPPLIAVERMASEAILLFFIYWFIWETEKHQCWCSTYFCIHWLILVCVQTGNQPCNLGVLGECPTLLSYLARAQKQYF